MSSEKKDHIAGIYNYCDRWCERCEYTSRCLLFTNESRFNTYEILNNGETPKSEDIFKEYFDNIEDEFDEEDDGFDDFEFEEDDDFDFAAERRELEEKKYPVEELADEYFKTSFEFVKKVREKFNFTDPANRNSEDPDVRSVFKEFEIVEWYCAFIGAKVDRACNSKKELTVEDDEDMKEIIEYDMNGTAKICVIAIKRSIHSLETLYKILPEYEKEIEKLLVILGKILNDMELKFPDYKEFKRPGFETEE